MTSLIIRLKLTKCKLSTRGQINVLSLYFRRKPKMNNLVPYRICGSIKTTPIGKLIYLILDDLADEDGDVIIPQRKLSNVLQISKSTVSRNLRRLEKLGAISIMPTFHYDGGRAANKYQVL